MHSSDKPSANTDRRTWLKWLAGTPLLPLTSGAAGTLLSACAAPTGAATAMSTAPFASAAFISMPAPALSDPGAMATTSVASALEITLQDGSKQRYELAYEPFFITGDLVPDGRGGQVVAGGYTDIFNRPIVDRSLPGKERQFYSDCPDGTSLLQLPKASVKGVKGNTVFAVVQFEYTSTDQRGVEAYGTLPSQMAVLTLDQDPASGRLSLVQYRSVDTSQAQGLWITCGSSLSPWNTHLSSEEYEPDAAFVADNKMFKAFSKNLFGDETVANPYHYGHLPEVTVNPDGTGTLVKHFCLGRISHELVQVMPDNRTVLMGDDYTNSGYFMFVADKEKNLSSGTLYVAKVGPGFSIDPADRGSKLSWLKLGHASSAEIEKLADSLKPSDVMTVLKKDPGDPSFTQVFYNGTSNWIRVKPGMEKAAAFLETHRYAYLMGGSLGFSKMEGTTLNAKDKVLYSALQNIQDSMVKSGKGWNLQSGIALEKPLVAGGVMALPLSGGHVDQHGDPIRSDWVPSGIRALLMGEDIGSDGLGNLAAPDKIANPDNLKFSERLRTLFIGEDSSMHVNNFVWAYNVDTRQLSRLMSMPAGAEATGLGVVDDLNGFTYITSNFQHAGDWIAKLHGKVQAALDPLVRANYKNRSAAAVGYLTGAVRGIRLP